MPLSGISTVVRGQDVPMTNPRLHMIDPQTPGFFHCISRGVRRARGIWGTQEAIQMMCVWMSRRIKPMVVAILLICLPLRRNASLDKILGGK